MKKFVVLLISLILFSNVYGLELNSKYAVLYNLNDQKVVYDVNKDEKTSIASLTKIMTTLVSIEHIDNLDENVVITYNMLKGLYESNAAVAGLRVGESVTYRDLLYCTMLPSGADCARALAYSISGDEATFVGLMNERAESLGLVNTHFGNIIGLDDDNNYGTVNEVAIILGEAIKNQTFKNVFEASEYTLSNGLKVTSTMRSSARYSNVDISYILGGKTGTTDNAGKCLASTAYDSLNDINYLLVTVGSSNKYGNILDAANIYTYYFENYKYYDVAHKGDYVKTIDTIYSKDVVDVKILNDLKYYTNEFDPTLIRIDYDGLDSIKSGSKQGLELGRIYIYYNDELLDTEIVYLESDVSFSLLEFIKANIIYISLITLLIILFIIFLVLSRKKKGNMTKLVLVRHGESVWNKENRFTGWTDVDLSEKGIDEAKEAGKLLLEKGYKFDIAYTSVLKRANHTLDLILSEMNISIPIKCDYRLNERHYGALQGLNKDETKEKYGEEQVKLWRRSADVRPPSLTLDDPRYPGNDPKYKGIDNLPLTENLNDTIKRVSEYYNEDISKSLKDGKNVLIVAHGNSLRGLIKYLDKLTDDEVISLEIPTGKPICYELDKNLNVIKHYYIEK